jgi:Flp pilus assembly protein TadG
VLAGMTGLVVDGGLLMVAHRRAQNAADAAALAAALDLLQGSSDVTGTVNRYVTQYNGLTRATAEVHVGPNQGPYKGNRQFVEVLVSNPVDTWFIQVLNLLPGVQTASTQTVRVRAVAGYEILPASQQVALLNPNANPGLAVDRSTLQVNGILAVNSGAAQAATTGDFSMVQSPNIQVVGGVDFPAHFQNLPGAGGNPLHTGGLPSPDPFVNLPAPTAANVPDLTQRGGVSLTSGSATLQPGVYDFISVSGSASVNFQPGIYVVASTQRTTAIKLSGSGSITGNGVMFYNTGSDYLNGGAGSQDALAGAAEPDASGNMPPAADNPTFGSTLINAQNVNLTGLNSPQSPFDGMLFYQRRQNNRPVTIQSPNANSTLSGTVYAKWANVTLGPGTYNAQIVAGSMSVGRSEVSNAVNINSGPTQAKTAQVFLVE